MRLLPISPFPKVIAILGGEAFVAGAVGFCLIPGMAEIHNAGKRIPSLPPFLP
jgi:hypothetical protein